MKKCPICGDEIPEDKSVCNKQECMYKVLIDYLVEEERSLDIEIETFVVFFYTTLPTSE